MKRLNFKGFTLIELLIVVAIIALLIAGIVFLYLAWKNNWFGIRDTVNIVVTFIRGLIQSGMEFINALTEGKLGALSVLWNNALTAIQLVVNTVLTNLRLWVQAFQAAFNGDWYKFGQILRQIWENGWNALTALIRLGWENVRVIFTTAIQAVVSFVQNTDWAAVGRNIMQGIANGITSAASFVYNAAVSAVNAAIQAMKGFLGISSPSKLAFKLVCIPTGQGAALGMQAGLAMTMPQVLPGLLPSPVTTTPGGAAVARTGGNAGSCRVEQLLQQLVNKESDIPVKTLRAITTEVQRSIRRK